MGLGLDNYNTDNMLTHSLNDVLSRDADIMREKQAKKAAAAAAAGSSGGGKK